MNSNSERWARPDASEAAYRTELDGGPTLRKGETCLRALTSA